MEHSNGLSNGYARNEGRLIADLCIGLNRLKYTTNIKLPTTDFQELLNGNFGDICSFLYALQPVKHLYVISSKKWNIQTDYPMGMPVMKGSSSQTRILVWTRKTKIMRKEKRKEGYSPDIKLPTDFQELLNGNFGDMCSFLYALHPVNICTWSQARDGTFKRIIQWVCP